MKYYTSIFNASKILGKMLCGTMHSFSATLQPAIKSWDNFLGTSLPVRTVIMSCSGAA